MGIALRRTQAWDAEHHSLTIPPYLRGQTSVQQSHGPHKGGPTRSGGHPAVHVTTLHHDTGLRELPALPCDPIKRYKV